MIKNQTKKCQTTAYVTLLGTIFILRKDIGVGVQKMAIFLTLCTENTLTLGGGGVQKSPKTPLRDIKMTSY